MCRVTVECRQDNMGRRVWQRTCPGTIRHTGRLLCLNGAYTSLFTKRTFSELYLS